MSGIMMLRNKEFFSLVILTSELSINPRTNFDKSVSKVVAVLHCEHQKAWM